MEKAGSDSSGPLSFVSLEDAKIPRTFCSFPTPSNLERREKASKTKETSENKQPKEIKKLRKEGKGLSLQGLSVPGKTVPTVPVSGSEKVPETPCKTKKNDYVRCGRIGYPNLSKTKHNKDP